MTIYLSHHYLPSAIVVRRICCGSQHRIKNNSRNYPSFAQPCSGALFAAQCQTTSKAVRTWRSECAPSPVTDQMVRFKPLIYNVVCLTTFYDK